MGPTCDGSLVRRDGVQLILHISRTRSALGGVAGGAAVRAGQGVTVASGHAKLAASSHHRHLHLRRRLHVADSIASVLPPGEERRRRSMECCRGPHRTAPPPAASSRPALTFLFPFSIVRRDRCAPTGGVSSSSAAEERCGFFLQPRIRAENQEPGAKALGAPSLATFSAEISSFSSLSVPSTPPAAAPASLLAAGVRRELAHLTSTGRDSSSWLGTQAGERAEADDAPLSVTAVIHVAVQQQEALSLIWGLPLVSHLNLWKQEPVNEEKKLRSTKAVAHFNPPCCFSSFSPPLAVRT
ncbi:hypothetical protein BHE74_00006481 [Ensete ventricosum]|nr:hypothetical protein BHE74_00006481 [Ensete ventricosum]